MALFEGIEDPFVHSIVHVGPDADQARGALEMVIMRGSYSSALHPSRTLFFAARRPSAPELESSCTAKNARANIA
jgi:hypothetical protein